MRKTISGAVTALLIAGGVTLTATSASAHTPSVSATCDALTVTADYYETKPGTEAVFEDVLVTEAVPYQPAVYGEPPLITPAVEYQPAVYETEYKFVHKFDWFHLNPKWKSDPNWNAESNPQSHGWHFTGETRQGALISPEVPEQDAVYGEPPLISPEVLAQDAVYESVEVTPASPADDTPNTVEIIIDGASLGVAEFGTDGDWYAPLAGTGHEYTVIFTAWNDPDGSKGWTKTFTGTTEPCEGEEEPPVTYQPTCTTVTGSHVITGDGTLTVAGGWAESTIAVPFSGDLADIGTVLDIDADPIQYVGLHIDTAEGTIVFEEEQSYGGDLWSTSTWEGVEPGLGYAAMGSITDYIEFNGDVDVTGIRLLYTHPEASSTTVGSFTIGCTLYTFEPEVTEPPVEEPPVEEPPVTEPPVEEPPVTESPAPAPVKTSTDTLAETGGDSLSTVGWLTGGALALALGALLTVLGIRRHSLTK